MNAKLLTRNIRRNRSMRVGIACPTEYGERWSPQWQRYMATRCDANLGNTWVGTNDHGRGIVHGPDADTDPEPFSRERY